MSAEGNDSAPSEELENIMVGFIGAGRMTKALAKGFITSGKINPSNIIVSAPRMLHLEEIQKLGAKVTLKNSEVVQSSDIVFIATKPYSVHTVLDEVTPQVTPNTLIVSIAGGVTISSMEQHLPNGTRVIRVMPNTPSQVSAGASIISRGSTANARDAGLILELLSGIGICEEISETLINAVTGVSGCGPAYAYVAIEALADGGVKMGLPRDLAMKLAAQTLLGAAKMVLETGKHPGQLKDEVCSPGGTTICAIHSLEKNGFRGSLIDAVEAAVHHANELSAKSVAKTESKL